jgi:hypothetical protein
MKLLEECKKRQSELLHILGSIESDAIWAGDELAAERFRRSASAAISQYEKIIHLLSGDQVGHA